MDKQYIVAISREYASGGHEIAVELSKRLGLPVYDHNLLDEIAEQCGLDVTKLNKYDEAPRRRLITRTVRGMSNSPEEAVAEIQFDFLKEKAASGESFIIVGRCAESVLANYPCLIPIFITGDEDVKIKRIMKIRNMDRDEALATIRRHDDHRKLYHNHFCEVHWGDSRAYDMCINSSALGIPETINLLEVYIKKRVEQL